MLDKMISPEPTKKDRLYAAIRNATDASVGGTAHIHPSPNEVLTRLNKSGYFIVSGEGIAEILKAIDEAQKEVERIRKLFGLPPVEKKEET